MCNSDDICVQIIVVKALALILFKPLDIQIRPVLLYLYERYSCRYNIARDPNEISHNLHFMCIVISMRHLICVTCVTAFAPHAPHHVPCIMRVPRKNGVNSHRQVERAEEPVCLHGDQKTKKKWLNGILTHDLLW